MGIYIKGMKMPSGCLNCYFAHYSSLYDEFKYYCDITGKLVGNWSDRKFAEHRHMDCPLVEEKTELVRCKDCKHWNGETHGCTRNPSVEPWFESDYCNYAARMVE